MRKFYSIVALFGLSVLSALVVGSTLLPTDQQANKLKLSFGQPNANKSNNTDNRIVGGLQATDAQFPHMVSLRRGNGHFCGGSIINQFWILTAAHCFQDTSLAGLTAVVGTNTLNAGGAAYQVAQITVHASFDRAELSNDIAVIRVSSPIEFSSKVQSIRLTSVDTEPFTATTLSGWGLTSYPGNSLPNELQFINLQTIDISLCSQLLEGAGQLGSGNVCTASPVNQGACQGDSGGALMQNYVQVGIVSWGRPCARGFPDVFTSVAFYHPWILSSIGGSV